LKIGLLSAILENKSFEEVIEIASNLDIHAVELACWPRTGEKRRYAGVSHLNPDELTPERVKEIKAFLKAKDVELSALSYYPNVLSDDKENNEMAIAHIKKLIDASVKLDIYQVNTFIGRDQYKTTEENFKEFAKVWPDIIKYAEEKEVRIGIENCPMIFSVNEWPGGKNLAHSTANIRRIFSEIKSDYFGLNFDPSHYVWQQMDYLKALREFKDKIFHVHLKDTKVLKDKLADHGILALPLEYMTPKIPGRGDIDWEEFINTLKEIGFEGVCAFEIEDRDFEETEELKIESIVLSKKAVERFF
jgi:sugar phosphate isomerase/epimerase